MPALVTVSQVAWLQEVDPDILTGFDLVGRDIRLLIERFRVLKLGPLRLGRTQQEYVVTASTNYRWVPQASSAPQLLGFAVWCGSDWVASIAADAQHLVERRMCGRVSVPGKCRVSSCLFLRITWHRASEQASERERKGEREG